MKPLVIAVDVDEVVADLLGAWRRLYNLIWRDDLQAEQITDWDMTKCVKPECGLHIYEILHRDDVYDYVDPIKGALEAVRLLRAEGHRVIFVSSCSAKTTNRKVEWLQRHGFIEEGPAIPDFIACQNKYLIRADYLIDDRPLNVETFPGTGILIRQPHNHASTWEGMKADSLLDAASLILGLN